MNRQPTVKRCGGAGGFCVARWLVFVALGVGCSGEGGGPRPASPPAPTNVPAGTSCEARTEQLAEQLAAGASSLPKIQAHPPARLPDAPGGAVVEVTGVVVMIEGDGGLHLTGEGFADATALGRRVASMVARVRDGAATPIIYVSADRDAPAAALASVAEVIPGAVTERRLLVRSSARSTLAAAELIDVPSVVALRRQLDAARSAADAAVASADAMRRGFGDRCASLARAFATTWPAGALERARSVPAALRDCRCDVPDFALGAYALLAGSGALDPPPRWVPLPAPPAPPRASVAAWLAARGP